MNAGGNSLDFSRVDVQRMRPRNVQKEKEFLYEEALKLKIRTNSYQEENTRLRTTVQILQVLAVRLTTASACRTS